MGSGPVQIGYRRIRATQTFQRTRPLQEGGPRPEVNLPFPSLFLSFLALYVFWARETKRRFWSQCSDHARTSGVKFGPGTNQNGPFLFWAQPGAQPDPEPIRMGWAQNSARLYREPIKMGPGPSNRKVTDLLVMILFCSFRLRMILFC